jgi:hypothetical protein
VSGYVYKRTEPRLWTVGFYCPDGQWEPDSDHGSDEEAAKRVAWLNGSTTEVTVVEGANPAKLLTDFAASLECGDNAEPPDGSLILVNESKVWLRSDQDRQGRWERADGTKAGDWYFPDGTNDGAGPHPFSVVMGWDEVPEDRKPHTFEVLYTPSDIARLAETYLD